MKKSFLLFLFPLVGMAECGPTACADVYVDTLYPEFTGNVYVGTSDDERKLSTCTAQSGVYLTLKGSDPGANMIYSLLLSAQAQGKKVMIRTEDGSAGCRILYATLKRTE